MDEQKLLLALGKTPNLAVAFIDECFKICFLNKKFEQIFELKSKEFVGKNFDELLKSVPILGIIKDSLNDKNRFSSVDFELTQCGKSYRLTLSNILENAKNFGGFIITLYDITHEKYLELSKAQNEQMLVLNSKMAVVGEMINSISHQQRQPLSAILLSLSNIEECLDSNAKNDEIYTHIKRAKNGVRLMDDTIKAFRSFYKNDNKAVFIDISDVINELIFIIKAQMNTNGITLEFSKSDGDFRVFSIAGFIKQILLSILANAKDELCEIMSLDADFEPKITINLQKASDEVCISISDNGRGIKDSSRIFDPFFTTKLKFGTGMGLYVAKIISEQKLNARLELTNSANPTTFCLFLKG